MTSEAIQFEIWNRYKEGRIEDLTYVMQFADLCWKFPYRETYREPLNQMYLFMKKHLDSKGKDDLWWEVMAKDLDVICERYKGTPDEDFARGYAVVVMNEIKRRSA